jgi:nucleoside-diphosphate-sugar epimerase
MLSVGGIMIPQNEPEPPVHVLGASGRSGQALCRALLADGIAVVPVVRSPGRWRATGLPAAPRTADLDDARALRSALEDAKRIVSTAHARFTAKLLAEAPENARFVLLGSTRRFSRFPDEHGTGVAAGETAFLASGRPGVMLHPTMIYGTRGEQNVQRLAAMLRRLPLVPLPGGGRNLVQPIHQDDVTRAIRAALDVAWDGPHALVIAGAKPMTYADFARQVAAAAGLKPPRIVPVPAALLLLAGSFGVRLPGTPKVSRGEIRRLLEDKAFDISPMIEILGVRPMPFAEGLARTFQPAPIM